jgi:hypothetical protein
MLPVLFFFVVGALFGAHGRKRASATVAGQLVGAHRHHHQHQLRLPRHIPDLVPVDLGTSHEPMFSPPARRLLLFNMDQSGWIVLEILGPGVWKIGPGDASSHSASEAVRSAALVTNVWITVDEGAEGTLIVLGHAGEIPHVQGRELALLLPLGEAV